MTVARFVDLHNLDDLARTVGTHRDRVVAYADSKNQTSQYHVLSIPKLGRRRHGQFRVVHKARQEWLAQFHRMVAIMVVRSAPFGDHVQGFVQGRSIRTNAELHLGARLLLHADISDFFDSISTAQVRKAFLSIGATTEIADLVARACTIDGRLRQGTRCSPALANLICSELDVAFLRLAEVHGARYSRYADDVTFSGDRVPDDASVAAILTEHGFKLRDGKCYCQRRGRSQFVTGLHVGDSAGARLPRRLKKRLRLILHYIRRFGVEAHFKHKARLSLVGDSYALDGMLRFVHSVEPVVAKRLFEQLASAPEPRKQSDGPTS